MSSGKSNKKSTLPLPVCHWVPTPEMRFLEKKVKRWEHPTRCGEPVYGGESREVTCSIQVLQQRWVCTTATEKVDTEWRDVPTVAESSLADKCLEEIVKHNKD